MSQTIRYFRMNIIFLDIDGVLNTHNHLVKQVEQDGINSYQAQFNFCPESLTNLKQIVEETNAKIVVSSTWRISYRCAYDDPYRKFWKAIMKNLTSIGMHKRVIGITPSLKDTRIRGEEIKAWMKDHSVDNFVIIDDDSDMGNLIDHLAQCSWCDGITKKVRDKAIKILKGEC